MNSTLVTWDIKKNERLEAKKRKLEALLNIFEKEDAAKSKVSKEDDSLENNFKTLKKELQRYVKKPDYNPSFSLSEIGSKALFNFKVCNETGIPSRSISPIFIQDIYHLLLKSVLGHLAPFPLNWCKLDHPQAISKTVLLVVDDLSKADVIKNISELSCSSEIFRFKLEFVSANIPFITELGTLHVISDVFAHTKQAFSSLFPVEKRTIDAATKIEKSLSKLHLLLSPIQLVMEHYPLPQTIYQYSKSSEYVFTKELYSPVTANSPMFALDCEMCRVVGNKSEVTRIAVVNEKLETVYHSLVKPKVKVIDYMTKYSGVTKEMLSDVKTTLFDVHKALQTILPSDAILCGQSLNCDLHALKMIHPYIIDTSVIFNESGIRCRKSSLRSLALIHLNETIQCSKMGHNPVEDSIASMKLVQLKLGNNIQYGDAVIEENIGSQTKDKNFNHSEKNHESENCKSEFKKEDSFFHVLTKFSKKIALIGDRDLLSNCAAEVLPQSVKIIQKSNPRKVGNALSNNIANFDLTVGHFVYNKDITFFNELNAIISQIYASCPNRTLLIVVASGINNEMSFQEIKDGMCMVVLKKV